MEKSVTRIVFTKILGIVIFLVFLGFLNFLVKYVSFSFMVSLTNFLNRNALFLIGISVVFLFAELMGRTEFPSNIFAPILNFVGAWMALIFLFTLLEAIQRRFNFSFLNTIFILKTPIFITILSLTFVFGYLPIIYKLIKERRNSVRVQTEPKVIEKIKIVPKIVERVVEKEVYITKKPSKKKKNVKKKPNKKRR